MRMFTAVFALLFAVTIAHGQITVVDEWDMNGNGSWQHSNNGLNLGGHYGSNSQEYAQIPDDGTFFFSPAGGGQNFGGKTLLTSDSDLTAGIVRISWTYTDMDWTVTTNLNNQVGFRVWNNTSASGEWVAIALQAQATASATNVWAYTKSSAGLGGLNEKTGRLFLGLQDSGTPRTIILDLDYANGEVRMSADSWQWNGGSDVHTNTVDFATAGVTNISAFQTYYQNWGVSNVTTFDNLKIEYEQPTDDVYIVDSETFTTPNTPTTNNFSFAAEEGDVIVVLSASNKSSDPGSNSVTIAGSATVRTIEYDMRSAGASAYYWHTDVVSNGIANVEFITSNSFNSVAAYQLRAAPGEEVVLLKASKSGFDESAAITNTYWFGGPVVAGLYLEAVSAYGANSTPLDSEAVVDVTAGTKRSVAHGYFSETNKVVNVWTNVLDNVAMVGLVFDSQGQPQSPTEYYEQWLSFYPGLGGLTNLTDHADSDVLDNLGEYAFDGNPLNGNNLGNSPIHYLTGGTDYLEYVYYERDDAAVRGLTSILEVTSDLIVGGVTNGIEFVGSGPSGVAGFNAFTNRIPTTADDKQFLNLKVQFTP